MACREGWIALCGAIVLCGGLTRGETAEKPAVSYEDLLGIVDLGVVGAWFKGSLAVSPDGSAVAVEARQADWKANKTFIRWWIVPLDVRHPAVDAGVGGEPILFLYEGRNVGYSAPQIPSWSPDSRWIAYRARHDGAVQLWRSNRAGSRQEQLTHNAGDVESYRWAADGRRLFFTTRSSRDDAAALLQQEGRRGYRFDRRFDLLGSREAIPFGSFSTASSSEGLSLWIYDLERGVERRATAQETSEYDTIRNSAGGVSAPAALLEDLRTDTTLGVDPPLTVVFSGGADGSKKTVCRARICTGRFKGVWLGRNAQSVFGLRWAGEYPYGAMTLFSWTVATNAIRTLLTTEDFLEGCSRSGNTLVCGHESARTPLKIVSIDLHSGTMHTIFDPNPVFAARKFGEVTSLTWSDGNGVEGFGHLVKPLDYRPRQRYPLIVVQYRSHGFLRGGIGDEYPIHIFAARNFAVLSFDRPEDWPLRASSRTHAEVEEKGWVGLHDRRRVLSVLEAGIDKIVDMGIADPRKIGITGLSDGGETLGFALIHAPRRFAAAATSGEFWNPIIYFAGGPRILTRLEQRGFGYPGAGLDCETSSGPVSQWCGVSVGLNAASIATPLLIQVSDAELLPETQTYAALRHYGKPVDMYVFPNEFHIKSQPVHRSAIYRRNVQWFRFWLQGLEEPDAVDAAQYRHWRALRDSQSARRSKTCCQP